MSKMRATVIAMLIIAVGLFVYNPVAFAQQAPPWHSDVMTVNQTASLGVQGTQFIPAWVKTDCAAVPTNGFAFSGGAAGPGCHGYAEEVVNTWLAGEWWDPRGGTEFMPPSGDHHRAGWRLMMQAHFSAGAWLAGFAPIASTFPFYPQIGLGAGPGETPVGTYELCADADGMGPGTTNAFGNPAIDTDAFAMEDVNDTGGADPTLDADLAACRAAARRAGALLLEFVDHHGEPLTPGRFPRYIPHERQAWAATLVTKYTASPTNNIDADNDTTTANDATGARVSQVFRTQHNFVTGTTPVTWFSMSDESAAGCAGGWCQWLWDPVSGTLYKLGAADPGNAVSPTVLAFTTAGATSVTSITVVDDYNDTLIVKNLNVIEKAPSEIYQVIGQWVELGGLSPANGAATGENQAFWQEFWGLSGPNFQSEEGANPYTWVICGGNGSSPAKVDCTVAGGAIDAPNGRTMAITNFGLDVINRYGGDLRPDDSADQGCNDANGNGICNEPGIGPAGDADCTAAPAGCDSGARTAVVQCTAGGDADNDPLTSLCESSEGATNGFGNDPNENIYYREAVENQQRGFIRENAAHAFSFINGIGVNNGQPGSGVNTALRQAVAQNMNDLGFLMSCFNCENLPEHQVRDHGVPNYLFSWTVTGGVGFEDHADIITGATGSIP